MGFIVNITTNISVLDLVFPFSCRGCGHTGEVLCGRCKKNLVGGFLDGEKIRKNGGELRLGVIEKLYAAGYREGVLRKMVVEYKYSARRAYAGVLAEILAEAIPDFSGENVVVVPMPTISRHIRERGFDHTYRLAKKLASRRGWEFLPVIKRVNRTTQVGQNEEVRERQAAEAYRIFGEVSDDKTYLLLDDIWTTGATMRSGAEVLVEKGARRVVGAVVCKGR
ncbi:MAG: phosphoribosyltransferase family protein [Candidatus Saccharibacteria bacterium]|nr:phosphoribosyltransferase family protein [Candidatus Saccharibacteria bacterium]